MRAAPSLRLVLLTSFMPLALLACGGNGSDGGGSGGAAPSVGGSGSGGSSSSSGGYGGMTTSAGGSAGGASTSAGGTTTATGGTTTATGGTGGGTTVASGPNGLFEIHYISGAGSSDSYTDVSGMMYSGPTTELVIWDKKKTEGDCSLYMPRTPFCDACVSPAVCVDTNVCRTPPTTQDVGKVTITGLKPPSGTNPLELAGVTTSTSTAYICGETLPVPPCTEGATIALSAAGKGSYPAFNVESQCIAPLKVTNPTIAIESGKTFTLNWTPSSAANARIQLLFDLSHHGGSKGQIRCDAADTGTLSVSGTLMASLMSLGVTGYPRAHVTRVMTGTTAVGTGQAQLKVYSDIDYVAQIPGLVSCQSDADCTAPQTCQVPGQMCGISCKAATDCPTGQTCLSTTKICG